MLKVSVIFIARKQGPCVQYQMIGSSHHGLKIVSSAEIEVNSG